MGSFVYTEFVRSLSRETIVLLFKVFPYFPCRRNYSLYFFFFFTSLLNVDIHITHTRESNKNYPHFDIPLRRGTHANVVREFVGVFPHIVN